MDTNTQDQQEQDDRAVVSDRQRLPSSVGMDVRKATLEVAVRPSGAAWQSANDAPLASPRWWSA